MDVEQQLIEKIAASISAFRCSPEVRLEIARATVTARCPCCLARIRLHEREVRRVPGGWRVFHDRCADRGVLQIRAAARSPEAMQRRRACRAAIDAAKARR